MLLVIAVVAAVALARRPGAEDDLDADLIEASAAEDAAALAAVEPAAPMDEPDPEPDPEPDTENAEVPSP